MLIVGVVFALAIIAYLALQSFVSTKIQDAIKQDLGEKVMINYKDIKVNLFTSQVSLHDVHVLLKDANTPNHEFAITKIVVKGLSYFQLLNSGAIEISNVVIENIKSTIYFNKEQSSNKTNIKTTIEKAIKINNLDINNAFFTIKTSKQDSTFCQVDNFTLRIKNFSLTNDVIASQIPFLYDSFALKTGNVFLVMNEFENINITSIALDNDLTIQNFLLKTKFTKKLLSQKITTERDYIDLKIPLINASNFNIIGPENNFHLEASTVLFENFNLDIYRNKLEADDVTIKQFFSKKLKQLSFPIHLPSMKITNGLVKYSELVTEQAVPGEIVFTELNSQISNVSNKASEPIIFTNTAKLMGAAPIKVDWTFYTENEVDLFKASGVIKNFETTAINSFLEPNLRAKAKGTINELYFTFSGDSYVSNGDMKMKYQDFEFLILKKDRLGVSKILTAIGNLFTNDGSNTDDNGYRYGAISVNRDATKSFFNYLWINVQDGIISTLTGNGKKDKRD